MTSVSSVRSPYGVALTLAAIAAVVTWWLLVVLADLRLVLTATASVALLVMCLWRPPTTMILMLTWLPLAGLVRRLFDYGAPVTVDPLLAVVPAFTTVLGLVAFWTFRTSLGASLRQSIPTRLVAVLVVVLALSIFNPIQGGVLPGLGGAVFLFFPVLWFFLGRAYVDEAFLHRLYRVITVIGVLSVAYGAYQAAFGMPVFELDWIVARQFSAMWVGDFIRPFSTFPNPEEWSRYLAVAATIALGFLLSGSSLRAWWAFVNIVCTAGLVLAGIRISVFGYLVSVAVLCAVARTSMMGMLGRLAALAAIVVAYVWLAPAPSPAEVHASDAAWRAFFGHTMRGVSAPFQEDTLWIRAELWWKLFTDVIPRYPIGMGLGVPTLGAWRFDATARVGTESYAIAVFVAAGVVGGGLLLASLAYLSREAWVLARARSDWTTRIVCAVLANVIFTSLVANSLSLYTIGPIGWGLMGWVSAQPIARAIGRRDDARH